MDPGTEQRGLLANGEASVRPSQEPTAFVAPWVVEADAAASTCVGGGCIARRLSRVSRWCLVAAAAVSLVGLVPVVCLVPSRPSRDHARDAVEQWQEVPVTLYPPAAPAAPWVPMAVDAPTASAIPAGLVVKSVQTTRAPGGKLEWLQDGVFTSDFPFDGPTIQVEAGTDQELLGFGGAFTEAAAVTFQSMSAEQQELLLESYFGPTGIGYTMGRVPINSCDFGRGSYSFDDHPGDFNLEYFDTLVTHDQQTLIPLIKRAKEKVRAAGHELRLLASPWSPPAWMKTNENMDHSGRPGLKPHYEDVWARYIALWISAYKAQGLPIWAITVQNEPGSDPAFEACVFTAAQEAAFLGNNLGPTLQQAHPEVLIFVYDFNKFGMMSFANAVYQHPAASKFAHGVAFHWYSGDHFWAVAQVHKVYPQAVLLASEATYEKHAWLPGRNQPYSDWRFGEGYAHDIIGDLNAGSTGWIDWNLLLDQTGGPNHVNNVCDAAYVADTVAGTLEAHPQYHFIAHFSKFIPPGSKRLLSTVTNSRRYAGPNRNYGSCDERDGLQATAWLRPDRQVALVVLNCGDDWVHFKIRDNGNAIKSKIPPHSIQTYLYNKQMY